MTRALISALLLAFCLLPLAALSQTPPMPGTKTYSSGEVTKGATLLTTINAVVVPAPKKALTWECGCGVVMPHWGHGYTIQSWNGSWSDYTTTNRAPVMVPPGIYRADCHLGNWPRNGQ